LRQSLRTRALITVIGADDWKRMPSNAIEREALAGSRLVLAVGVLDVSRRAGDKRLYVLCRGGKLQLGAKPLLSTFNIDAFGSCMGLGCKGGFERIEVLKAVRKRIHTALKRNCRSRRAATRHPSFSSSVLEVTGGSAPVLSQPGFPSHAKRRPSPWTVSEMRWSALGMKPSIFALVSEPAPWQAPCGG